MGGGGSKYKIHVTEEIQKPSTPWLATSTSKVQPFKKETWIPCAPIGKGKFGVVYMSKHSVSQLHVAIKYISKELIHSCDSATRIQQEMEISNRLSHPFIIHFFGAFETPAYIAMVLEYAVGGELYTVMKKAHKFPEEQAKFYFCEIALALDYLHNKLGIVYRDLKPENILIDRLGHVKLCDFGFAVPLGTDQSDVLKDGCGTAMYVAPEIAGGFMKRAHGFPVDWWSLGCVLMEMTTGNAPFGDTANMSKFEVFNNINSNSVSYPIFMNADLKFLLKGLLEKEPTKRFGWDAVKACKWLQGMQWDDLLALKVPPPWQPKDVNEPNHKNFLKWNELSIPTDPTDGAVTAYCSTITLPRPRESGGGGGGVGSGGEKFKSHNSPTASDDMLGAGSNKMSSSPVSSKKPNLNRRASSSNIDLSNLHTPNKSGSNGLTKKPTPESEDRKDGSAFRPAGRRKSVSGDRNSPPPLAKGISTRGLS